MVVAEEDGQGITLTCVHGVLASQTDDLMSKTGAECPDELTWLSGPASTSLCAVTILASFCTTGAVRKESSQAVHTTADYQYLVPPPLVRFLRPLRTSQISVVLPSSIRVVWVLSGESATGLGRREHGLSFFDGVVEEWGRGRRRRREDSVIVGSQRCHWHSDNNRWSSHSGCR
jgi:hypothetical protein